MTNEQKRNMHYTSYRTFLDLAVRHQKNKQPELAAQHLQNACKELMGMAELEAGETRKQRLSQARALLDTADELKKGAQSPSPTPQSEVKGSETKIPNLSFDDIAGMEDVKQLVRESVIDQMKHPEIFEAFGVAGGTGILLYGLPGTGKTTVAKAIAHELGAALFVVYPSDINDKYVGGSEKNIRRIFDEARQYPCSMIFFDDFDELGRGRTEDANHNNKVIIELLNQIQGFRENENILFLLAATNKPWNIDSALVRGGRFGHHIYVPLPDLAARVFLLKSNIKQVVMAGDVDLETLAQRLRGYNGADIVEVCKTANLAATSRVVAGAKVGEGQGRVFMKDLMQAADGHISTIRPSEVLQMREYMRSIGASFPDGADDDAADDGGCDLKA